MVEKADLFKRFGLYGTGMYMRPHEVSHNGSWYNTRGERLGWGDLDSAAIKKIMMELKAGEVFVILGEQASHWAFEFEKEKTKGVDYNNPGVDYICQNVEYLITKDGFFAARPHRAEGSRWEYHSLVFIFISQERAASIIRGAT